MRQLIIQLSCFSDAPVRTHLKSVYASLAMTIMSASAGAYTHLFTNLLRGGGILFALLSMGLVLALHATPDNGKNRSSRLALLLGFGFFSGLGTGPLLEMAIMINPGIIPNAFMLSAIIFACFSGAALYAPDGSYLYLGGSLLSGLSTLFWLGFLNLFFQSQLLFQVSFLRFQELTKDGAESVILHKVLTMPPPFDRSIENN